MSHSLPEGWFESGHGAIAVFVKDFRDPLERKKKLLLRPWAGVKDIKDQLQVVFNVPASAQQLYYQGRELKNAHNLQESGIYQDGAVVDFVARRQLNLALLYGDRLAASATATATARPSTVNGSKAAAAKARENVRPEQAPVINIHPYGAHLLPIALMKITHQALQGLALGLAPVLAMDGTGGTYFFKDPSHRNVGCFKPQDEEPFGPYNPRGLVGELGQSGLRRGILSGEACERELAAYLLDKDHFAGVPATSLVEARHPVFKYGDAGAHHFKVGSLQEFVRHDDVVSDLSPSQFAVHQVHKIVLLDMRLLNTDRNDANILVRKKRSAATGQVEYELIPIDHGYCLPQFLEIAWCDWCWYNWPQLKEPLSADDRAYVLSLSALSDCEALAKKIPLRRACRRNLLIAGMVVQKGVRADLVLYDIARIMCRDDLDAPSVLERLCLDAFRQVVAQRKAAEHPPHLSASAPSSPRNGKRVAQHAPLSIDTTAAPREPSSRLNGGQSPIDSGARSPPGFWASFAPFSAFDDENDDDDDDDDDDDEDEEDESETDSSHSPRQRTNGMLNMSWDQMAARALSKAATAVQPASSSSNSNSAKPHSPVPSSFTSEPEKDEFETLNDALDDNAQDEKLFLSLLGRLLDEQVDKCRRNRQPNKAPSRPPTRR
ncbi:hypothetical protein PybrP1_003781 [[Pythium] brassicae (nom. inval.)]|nr:hypothetical protein PybrP1_003781 [[Pythium] brassicae (nom. inval.)]